MSSRYDAADATHRTSVHYLAGDLSARVTRWLPVTLTAIVLLTASCGAGSSSTTPAGSPSAYRLGPTIKCLRMRGAVVSRVRPRDSRLRAFRDLAQRNSIQARNRGGTVALAFFKTAADTEILTELLRIPSDTYRTITRRNVVLFAQRATRAPLANALDCLRS